jgi:hypothetical protein
MPRARSLVIILGTLLSAAAFALGGQAATPDPNSGSLGYGFGAQLDQPYQAVGAQATATVFFFNLSGQDAFGLADPIGGEGCSFFVNILDDKGRLVRRPRGFCPLRGVMEMPQPSDPTQTPPPAQGFDVQRPVFIGPFPFPAGTFRRFDVPLPLAYASSETGDPDGTLLPGGLYTLQATQFFNGPGPGGSPFEVLPFQGGDPEARVPFRIFQCSPPAGSLPMRELAQGAVSGIQIGAPTFAGEDLVVRTAEAGLQFWRQHTASFVPPPPPPAVDLAHEMVLVSIAGTHQGGGSIRITGVEEKPCHLEVAVLEVYSGAFLDFQTTPFDIVAVPRSLKEVVFIHQSVFPPAAP